jgi:hypothetical protein
LWQTTRRSASHQKSDVVAGVGCVLLGEKCGTGEDEAAHRRKRATERNEHALKAGEHAFAAHAVFADDDGGGFAEPERGAFVRRGVFEKFLQHAAPRVPVRAGADQEAVGALEGGEKLRAESWGLRAGNRRLVRDGERGERETLDGGAAGEVAAGVGEEAGGIARVAGEGGVEEEKVGAAGGHGGLGGGQRTGRTQGANQCEHGSRQLLGF